MNTCPNCRHPQIKIVMTSLRASGNRYRRYECTACTHRWSVLSAECAPKPRPKTPGRANYETRRMTDKEAAQIILSDESAHEIAKRTGFSYGTIWAIRQGNSYSNVYELLQPLLNDD
jgi:transposase-like protein